MADQITYLTEDSLKAAKKEYDKLKDLTIPEIAKRIDEAKQQGDLSENAEYHAAREEMSWAQGKLQELDQLISNAQIITHQTTGAVSIGSKIVVKYNNQNKTYTIVGPQEINPAKGFISNESPLGEAFIGHRVGDQVEIRVPSGKVVYEILEIQ